RGSATDLEERKIPRAGKRQVIGAPEAAAVAEVDRVPVVGHVARDALLLEVPGDEKRRGREIAAPAVRCADRKLAGEVVLDGGLPCAGEEVVPLCAGLWRRVCFQLKGLDLVGDLKRAAKAPCGVEDILMAVAELCARADIGAIAEAR